ncbi:hypothetical protein Gotri_026839 [Gossypium trilobum]|uniref:Uncharacterized protein n=1 Tax=Gossypium trilobum TaxID=34281 RepID=A0A7J9FTE6_9ROSI|nr:hypothetical protein [Gossypium trilobum]
MNAKAIEWCGSTTLFGSSTPYLIFGSSLGGWGMRSFPQMSRLPLFDMVLGRIVLGVGLEMRPFFMPLETVLHQQRSFQLVAWTIILKEHKCCIDWLEDMIRVLDKRATIDLMTTLWNN